MRFRAGLPILLAAVSVSAMAGPFDGVTPCHDMKHLLDAGLAAYKAEREHPQEGGKTFCQSAPGVSGVEVCMTGPILPLGDAEDSHYTVVYKIDGKVMQTWVESGPELSDPYDFTVESADLGGDGKVETIFGVMEAVSNGLAVEGWSLYIVPAGGKTLIGPIDVENYMYMSGLYQVPGRQGCVLLSSKWEEDTEPGRGVGMYIKGHWYVLDGDKLVHFPQLPPVEHRLLYSFGDQIAKGDSPFAWFKDPAARLLKP